MWISPESPGVGSVFPRGQRAALWYILAMNLQRPVFAISTMPDGLGPFVANDRAPVRMLRDARMFDADAADAVLRTDPLYALVVNNAAPND